MPLTSHYNLQIQILSPVHIGDGTELLRNIDYVTHDDRTWVVNQDAVMERALTADGRFNRQLIGRPVAELIDDDDFGSSALFNYRMPGVPTNRPLKSHIKSLGRYPYLPGSTIKGMLRTAFVRGLYIASKQRPDLRSLGKSRSWAGQPVERKVMGANPNEDLFRAVRITDSEPVGLDRLRVTPMSIYPTAKSGSAGVIVDVEALREETIFTARMTIDEWSFASQQAQKRLKWGDKREQINRMVRFAQRSNKARLIQEVEYFTKKQGPRSVMAFYDQLVERFQTLEDGQFLAQLGWGAGWNSKTLNDLLTEDQDQFARLVRDYRMTRFSQTFKPGDQFPASRHLVLHNGNPVRPMGWVLVTIS